MAKPPQNKLQSKQTGIRLESTTSHRSRPLHVLFVHRDADAIDSCVQELKKAQFIVRSDFVLNLEQCTKLLGTHAYDVVVAEHPGTGRKENRSLQLLHQTMPEIPLLLLATSRESESKEELFAANHELKVIPKLFASLSTGPRSHEPKRIDPIETEWKRKDGTILKARLRGHGVFDDQESFAGYEIIAVDATEQRTLEDQLRHEASSDSLTGLGNHRRLFEVLHAEICRSGRSGREFSLLLLDLDGLKKINDQFGHLVGSRALCRVGQTLADCCRSIDTAARHGGDEFAVVLPETAKAAAASVARRICELLENDTEDPALSVSIGIATYPHDADTIGTLVYAADTALYAVKSKNSHTLQAASAPRSHQMDPNPAFTDIANDANTRWKEEIPNG